MCIFLSLISSIDPFKIILLVQNEILCYSSWMTLPLEQMKCTHTEAHTYKDSNLCEPSPGPFLPLLCPENSSQR